MDIKQLAECFGRVILDYNNTTMLKASKPTLKVSNHNSFLSKDEVGRALEQRIQWVVEINDNRETHLRLCLQVFNQLIGLENSVEKYANKIAVLHAEGKHSDIAKQHLAFSISNRALKDDLENLICHLYRLNHEYKDRTITFNGEDYPLNPTCGMTWGLKAFGESLKKYLLRPLSLSDLSSQEDVSMIVGESLSTIFESFSAKVKAIIEAKCVQQKDIDVNLEELSLKTRDRKSLEVLLSPAISSPATFHPQGSKMEVKEKIKQESHSSWGLPNLLGKFW